MKKDIHPEYVACKVRCGCGSSFESRAVVPEITVEICSSCHPFYTGDDKIVDSLGRVDRFTKKFGTDYFKTKAKKTAKKKA